jgi:hypothetical protein
MFRKNCKSLGFKGKIFYIVFLRTQKYFGVGGKEASMSLFTMSPTASTLGPSRG